MMRFILRESFWSPMVCLLAIVCLCGPGGLYGAKQQGQKAGETRTDNGLKMTLVWCPPGNFTMGSPKSEKDRKGHNEDRKGHNEDQVQITLTNGYWLGQTEITQGQWEAVMGTTPWKGKDFATREGFTNAASNVSWDDAIAFCKKLTEQERKAGRLPNDWEYTLPTEAQWEYACRAGTTTAYSFGDDASDLGNYAWFQENCVPEQRGNAYRIGEKYAHAVGTKKPNPWGLSDMHGNVWEWCRDWYAHKLPGGRDPEGTTKGSYRVHRGGSWSSAARDCRSANRGMDNPWRPVVNVGFRVAQVLSRESKEESNK